KRGLVVILVLLALVAGVVWFLSWDRADPLPSETPSWAVPLPTRVEQQHKATAEALAKYRPTVTGRIDDLGLSAADLLRQLPGVVSVEVPPATGKPPRRLIQLRAWHHVPRDRLAAELRSRRGRSLTEAEVDAAYTEHLLQVELVQLEHLALLRCLAKHHGLRRVFAE